MDARIGQLMRDGRPVFYAYVNGYNHEPFEGSLEQVEIELGLRLAGDDELYLEDGDSPAPMPVKASRSSWDVRRYLVTVTPRYAISCGYQDVRQYTVEIEARSRNAAIKEARDEHNENHWNNPARYRARLKPET